MAIEFPNLSHSYDRSRRYIRFSGYDGTLERQFYVEEDALRRLDTTIKEGESALFMAFDRHRDRICEVARKVYRQRIEGPIPWQPQIFPDMDGNSH
jgi:hypothetical protein